MGGPSDKHVAGRLSSFSVAHMCIYVNDIYTAGTYICSVGIFIYYLYLHQDIYIMCMYPPLYNNHQYMKAHRYVCAVIEVD